MTLSRNRKLYETWSLKTSVMTTKLYSTSFSIGIKMLDKTIRNAVYGIYGFVRLADEIVDTLHEYDKELLLKKFIEDTYFAIENKVSTNPILHSFQQVVHQFNIDMELIQQFLKSMEMDLTQKKYTEEEYKTYILGSAEVVGLMCLKVFCNGNQEEFLKLKTPAMQLGAAFQKINFLRDIHADEEMGRMYFPNWQNNFDEKIKAEIINDIQNDFDKSKLGIKLLPKNAKLGVFIAYTYYQNLLTKIKALPAQELFQNRVRISDRRKIYLLLKSYFIYMFNK